jgi:glucans biosynthesis protein C
MDEAPDARDASARHHALDGLRGGLMLLGIAFHAALPYTTIDIGGFKDVSTDPAFDALVVFLHVFRMPLFFLIAGFFGAMLYARRGGAGFARNRARRIAVPLAVGWLVLCPAIGWGARFARRVRRVRSVSLALAELPFPRLIVFRLYHLWFLAALLGFYAVALGAVWVARHAWPGATAWLLAPLPRVLATPWRSLALAVPMWLVLLPTGLDAETGVGLVLLLLFGLGWALHARPEALAALGRYGWHELAVAAALFAAVFPSVRQLLLNPREWDTSDHLLVVSAFSLIASLLVFGWLGVSVRHLGRPRPWVRYLSDASYWLYLIHLPVVIWTNGLLAGVHWAPGLKWLATLSIAAPILLAVYHFALRGPATAAVLGGRARRAGADAARR